MRYEYVFFDMDGTLSDTSEGVIKSFEYSLGHFGIPLLDDMTKCMGPSIEYSLTNFFNLSPEKAKEGLAYYREYYMKTGIFQCRLFDGILDLLRELKKNGVYVSTATCKPEPFAKQVVKHLGIEEYFDFVAGATIDEKTRASKKDVLEYAIAMAGNPPKEKCVLIGDTIYDTKGAEECGVDCIWAEFGFGKAEEIKNPSVKYSIKTPLDALDIIL